MFTVGDFSRLAQVSKRLLRYYDQIDLFKPHYVEKSSGYRFYSVEQMPELNRILALKDLGLSLDQIRDVLSDNISTTELQKMLINKKQEIHHQLQKELEQVRKIENRLTLLQDQSLEPLNVVLKEVPNYPVARLRRVVDDFSRAVSFVGQLHDAIPYHLQDQFMYCVCYTDQHENSQLDMEFGVILDKPNKKKLLLPNGMTLSQYQLEGATMMATTIIEGGSLHNIQTGYTSILKWIGSHNYQLAGTPRELMLQLPQDLSGNGLISEIQFPVEPIPNLNTLLY